ncbi:MAG TPA: lamin tail domain-containing protein [Polyangia bacterium]|nr:lamin tail domain-containing protein [Polyangia bacterium]
MRPPVAPPASGSGASTTHVDAAIDLAAEAGRLGATASGDGGADARIADGRADAASPSDGGAEAPADVSLGRAPSAGDVVIDELLIDPTGNDLGHEWIEVVNVTNETLDLSALHVSDDSSDVAVETGPLAPGARLVLGQSIDRAHNGDAPVDVAYGTRLSLNNGADHVALCAGACADGVTLDAFSWTMAFGDAFVGHAIVVEHAPARTCAAATPYGAGGNFGTPGAPNPPCVVIDASAELQSPADDHGDAAVPDGHD